MAWKRLYIVVEGQSELAFVNAVICPHLVQYSLDVRPRIVLTNRKLGKRGGIFDFAKIRDDLKRLFKSDANNDARFTTMVDLYALPDEFPGWEIARKSKVPADRVKRLEDAFGEEMGDDRFLPYIQLHEFETLHYCDLDELATRIAGSETGIKNLKKETQGLSPEDINEGAHTAPSKRIIRHVPIYERNKVRVGAPAAAAIGLPKLRNDCPHFAAWISQLEAMGEPLAV